MIVVKFGGTSLAGTERMRAAARIVAAHRRDTSVVCVVSALAGVTDTLLRIAGQTASGTTTRTESLAVLRTRHQRMLAELMTTASTPETTQTTTRFETLWSVLEADLAHLRTLPADPAERRAHAVAAFSGWGERLAELLFSAALAMEGMVPDAFEGEPVILGRRGTCEVVDAHATPWEGLAPSVAATRDAVAPTLRARLDAGSVPVLPGYLGRTRDGLVTILGRNGSDYSAAVLAAALGATALYIYSDVAGVHRADPRAVPDAEPLPALTYADAAEIAGLGARVLHPATLRPLAAAGIPLHLRSTFAPQAPGTDIGTAAFVHARQGGPDAWVVVARPLSPERPLFGSPSDWAPGLVEVTGVFLRHADLIAWEDDHLAGPGSRLPEPPPGMASDGPFSGALDLLTAAPRPVGLALSHRRLSVAVPAAESVMMQRRLYAALWRAGGLVQANGDAHSDSVPRTERRRTS